MVSQDLLYSILPRAPVQPGSGDFGRELANIPRTPASKGVETHKDPLEHAPQDDYHPAHHDESAPSSDEDDKEEKQKGSDETGQEHIDLFV